MHTPTRATKLSYKCLRWSAFDPRSPRPQNTAWCGTLIALWVPWSFLALFRGASHAPTDCSPTCARACRAVLLSCCTAQALNHPPRCEESERTDRPIRNCEAFRLRPCNRRANHCGEHPVRRLTGILTRWRSEGTILIGIGKVLCEPAKGCYFGRFALDGHRSCGFFVVSYAWFLSSIPVLSQGRGREIESERARERERAICTSRYPWLGKCV